MPAVKYHEKDNVPKSGIMGVSVQGSGKSSPGDPDPTLLSVDPYLPELSGYIHTGQWDIQLFHKCERFLR